MIKKISERFSIAFHSLLAFLRRHWIGTSIILLATIIFFWPLIVHIGTYSEGGDAMFNAWTLSRDQHCILQQACPNYSNANIYFPHKDTMLYSETQLSAGFLTLPLYFINQNPIFSYNVFTILSFFLSGWFMYLLAKRLSRGHEVYSILAAFAFEFAPIRMSSISHLQNLSIFYLPLILLLLLKYTTKPTRKTLIGLFITLVLQFYASWYQMVFVLIALAVILGGMLLSKIVIWKSLFKLSLIVLLAVVATLPLAHEYVRFSKANKATFSVIDQAQYSSSVADYVKPNSGTLIGKVYYHLRPHSQLNSYNQDSYSYHGVVLYVVAGIAVLEAFRQRRSNKVARNNFRFIVILGTLGLLAFIVSLGPLLKLHGSFFLIDKQAGLQLVIPMPYYMIDKLMPQLSFIRAIGRISVLSLFVLCSTLALLPVCSGREKLYLKYKTYVVTIITLLMIVEIMPIHRNPMATGEFYYHFTVPTVYSYIKAHQSINNLVIISADKDYPGASIPVLRAEETMWSGFYNRNIFNGYSGYTPPTYFRDINDFDDFHTDDVPKMRALHIQYVLVDKQLSKSDPNLAKRVAHASEKKSYEDNRYALFKL